MYKVNIDTFWLNHNNYLFVSPWKEKKHQPNKTIAFLRAIKVPNQ